MELDEARIRIEEVSKSLRERLDAVPSDASDLDAIEARLASIDRLSRKYGDSTDDILDLRESIVAELEELQASEEDRQGLG